MGKSNQNISSAVMAQRHAGREEYDYYPTHPWATRALCEVLINDFGLAISTMRALEPACGEGFMSRPLSEYFGTVFASDIQDFSSSYPKQDKVCDFLLPWAWDLPSEIDAVITNPPFTLAEQFVFRALDVACRLVCIFARSAFLEGGERYESLFSKHPPSAVYQFSERVALHKGRLDEKASSATAYSWFIWDNTSSTNLTRCDWIPRGTKARLTKIGDYPKWAKEMAPAPLFDGARL